MLPTEAGALSDVRPVQVVIGACSGAVRSARAVDLPFGVVWFGGNWAVGVFGAHSTTPAALMPPSERGNLFTISVVKPSVPCPLVGFGAVELSRDAGASLRNECVESMSVDAVEASVRACSISFWVLQLARLG